MIYQPHFLAVIPDGVQVRLTPSADYAMLFSAARHLDNSKEWGAIDYELLGQGTTVAVLGNVVTQVQPTWQWCEWGILRTSAEGASLQDAPYLRVGGAGMPEWRLQAFAGYLHARASFLVFQEGAVQMQHLQQAQQMAQQAGSTTAEQIRQRILNNGPGR